MSYVPDWAMVLQSVPTYALDAELARRALGEQRQSNGFGRIVLRGLTVDTGMATIWFGGDRHVIRGRKLELIHALAVVRERGQDGIPRRRLAHQIWRGFEGREAIANLATYLAYIRQELPGLIVKFGDGLGLAKEIQAIGVGALEP